MAPAIIVPDRYAWVLLVGAGSIYLTFYQSATVERHRRAAKIPLPQAYAEKAEALASTDAMKFNCAQRAHQNTLETLPQTLFYLLFSGLRYPTVAASLGAAYLVGRVLYTQGYSTGEPKKRNRGSVGSIAGVGLMLTATWSAGEFVYSTLY